jgi:hypothetical protein
VEVARGVGKHVPEEVLVGLLGALRLERNRCLQPSTHSFGRRLPGWSFPDGLKIRNDVIDHPMAEPAEGFPVGGVERLFLT